MINIDQLQGTIHHRLSVFGVPTYTIKPFAELVVKWVKDSGVEWTVKRLKSLKVDLYRTTSGLPSLTWLKKNRKGQFTGPIGSLFRWASLSDHNFEAVVHTLMCYSLFEHRTLSITQKEKFVKAVTAKTDTTGITLHEQLQKFMKSCFPTRMGLPVSGKSILEFRGSPSKRAPIFDGPSMSQEGSGLASVQYFEHSPYHYRLYKKYKSLYSGVLQGITITNYDELFKVVRSGVFMACPWTEGVWGGEVHFLQEPGLKLRAIASPYLVHQLALKPLGDALYNLLRTLPWDCTHDHKRPISAVQRHLSEGRKIYSVDLSNATDYFPLEIQLTILRSIFGNHPSIDLFKEISRSQWKSSIGTITWNQGQPLGLYPSFASFAFSHGIILSFLNNKPFEGEFYVLGDDVIILDDVLYSKYIQLMNDFGCPIAMEKSIASHKLCEFAGKVITSTKVVPSYKWREVSNDNFLDIVRNYGRRAVSLLTHSQKDVVEKVQHCVEPFGLNWSYPGSNLEKMSELTVSLFNPKERVTQSMIGLFRTVAKNYYNCPSDHLRSIIQMEYVDKMIRTFDEKVAATLTRVLPSQWVEALKETNLLGGFSGVPGALGITDLPPETLAPSRVTTLDRYRNILGR